MKTKKTFLAACAVALLAVISCKEKDYTAYPPTWKGFLIERNGKHYVAIRDYESLRRYFGLLLRKVQRIKSEGNYDEARALVETYGIRLDPALHAEVAERYAALDVAPFAGFVNPRMTPVMINNKVADVRIDYEETYEEQMLRYSQQYSVPMRIDMD